MYLAGLHLEVSSVPCAAAAAFVTWALKGHLKVWQTAESRGCSWELIGAGMLGYQTGK